jgi:hypothetical protein
MNRVSHLLKAPHGTGLISSQGKVMKIILAILAVIVIAIVLLFYFTSGLSDAAHEQLSALKSGNIESAYNMTSKAFQQTTSMDNYKSFVEKYPILKNYKSVSFTERKIENGSGYLAGIIESADGSQMKIEYQLVKEDGKWKIQAMQLTPMEKK